MPEACIFNISQFAGTIVSTCVGAIIGYFSARRISDRNARAAAVARLRASFAPAQAKLFSTRVIGNHELREFFNAIFLDHAAAIEEFRPFVSDNIAYQKACDEYRDALFSDDALCDSSARWLSGMMVNEHGDDALDFLDVIDQRIKAILSYA